MRSIQDLDKLYGISIMVRTGKSYICTINIVPEEYCEEYPRDEYYYIEYYTLDGKNSNIVKKKSVREYIKSGVYERI